MGTNQPSLGTVSDQMTKVCTKKNGMTYKLITHAFWLMTYDLLLGLVTYDSWLVTSALWPVTVPVTVRDAEEDEEEDE